MSQNAKRFYGKYRGKVSDNVDPMFQGRVRAKVPAVLGDEETGWAMPSVPYAGSGVGFFFIPPKDANVWIEFEGGNPDHPIWSGCFWGAGEVPKMPADPGVKVIKTDFATITINDQPGINAVTIETSNGLKVNMDITGIALSNGTQSIKLTKASVTINEGALEVV